MWPGRVLGERYHLLRPIAEGSSGEVWAARDEVSGDEVAIKAVSLDRAGWRAEVRDRFLLESRVLRLVHDAHLVGVRDAGETDDGHLYSVLDLLEGDTLADRMAREGRLAPRDARGIALGIARGLGVLHARGIVHRDLKPANVVLHREGETLVPTIIDLGVSKVRVAAADPIFQAKLTATGQVLADGQVSDVTVQRGAVGAELTEITSGLSVGQTVVLADRSQPMETGSTTGSSTGLSGLTSGTTTRVGVGGGGTGFAPGGAVPGRG